MPKCSLPGCTEKMKLWCYGIGVGRVHLCPRGAANSDAHVLCRKVAERDAVIEKLAQGLRDHGHDHERWELCDYCDTLAAVEHLKETPHAD